MSRNFELLRRAGKSQALFVQSVGCSGLIDRMPIRRPVEKAEGEAVKADDQDEALRSPRTAGQIVQGELVKLVRRVFLCSNSHASRAVSFSSIEGNGSSEICFQAGQTLAAQISGSVCLVDANLHAPSLHRLFEVNKFPGLLDATGERGPIKDYAVPVGGGNLWLVPSGSPVSERQESFAADRLHSRIVELKEQFDFVLIDAPLLNSHTDAVLLGQMTDGIILVLEANSTRRETARMIKEDLEAAKVKILGAVLNNRTFPIPETLYRRL
jgi:Mrp family chromosome partitioning ATPase